MLRASVTHAFRAIPGAGSALSCSPLLCMRFDKEAAPDSRAPIDEEVFQRLPESMRPKKVSPEFTPFPLPKYDSDLGFGPVQLSDIPDVEAAAQRMREARQKGSRQASPFKESEDVNEAFMAEMLFANDDAASDAVVTAAETAAAPVRDAPVEPEDGTEDVGVGYQVESPRFPVLDRIRCHRSLGDLLAQFMQRPAREARTATVLDLANTMEVRTDEELEKMLYELGALFAVNGNGLQFLAAKVNKLGRAYHAADELMKAFVYCVDAATETFVRAQPGRLPRSPALSIQLLHFLALIKVFEPNLWYSPNPNAPSNRADYSHNRGVNAHTAHKRTGEELYDYMASVVLCEEGFLSRCSDEQLLDLLAGFGGVMPGGLPEGGVANALVAALFARWAHRADGGVLAQPGDAPMLERLYMLMKLFHIEDDGDAVLAALLPGEEAVAGVRREPRKWVLGGPNRHTPRGPDFFASVARDRRLGVQKSAAALLVRSMVAAREAGDAALQAALAESGFEFLLSFRDKASAVALAKELDLDTLLLQHVPHMETVARRLCLEREGREARMTAEACGLADVQATLRQVLQRRPHAAEAEGKGKGEGVPLSLSFSPPSSSSSYLTVFEGTHVHPVRTLLSDLRYVNQVDNVFLLHSSIAGGALEAVLSTIQRLQSGKDALMVTTSCLRELTVRTLYSRTDKERANARRALEMLAYELEKGRAVLLPATEELALHDAGTFCDEDLMLWTVAAFFARELPLTRVNTLMSTRTTARDPHKHLKGEHSPLTASMDLYQPDAPLLRSLRSKELRSVTHHVRLRRKVRDREGHLHDIDPTRSRFVYRRDKALFDKYHVTARNLAPGFSRGALNSDLRGLGYYTPDHPQVPYTPLTQKLAKRSTASSAPLATPRP